MATDARTQGLPDCIYLLTVNGVNRLPVNMSAGLLSLECLLEGASDLAIGNL
jgi:hypothetical protein